MNPTTWAITAQVTSAIAAETVNAVRGRTVLPMGEPRG